MNLSSIFHNYIFLFPAILYRKYQVVHLRKYLKFNIFFSNYPNPVEQYRFPIQKPPVEISPVLLLPLPEKVPSFEFFSQQNPSRLSVLVKSTLIKTFIWIFVKDPAVSFTQPFVAFGCTFRICCFKVFFCHTPFILTETSL